MALVRAVVAPLYLVGTVVLSYAFALGASSLVFTHLLGQPDSDPGLPLFAFIFLVALGVDYNIFLISRIREELRRRRHAGAVAAGLRRTGGVITSAGLILAGTFAVLMALPVESLFQAGFTIALGMLVDTFAGPRLPRAGPRGAAGRAQLVAGRCPRPLQASRCAFCGSTAEVLDRRRRLDSFWRVGGGTRCRRGVRVDRVAGETRDERRTHGRDGAVERGVRAVRAARGVLALALALALGDGAGAAQRAGRRSKVLVFHGPDRRDHRAGVARHRGRSARPTASRSTRRPTPRSITAANLANYRAVVFLNTAGNLLSSGQEAAVQAFVARRRRLPRHRLGRPGRGRRRPRFDQLLGARPAADSPTAVTEQTVVGRRPRPPGDAGPRRSSSNRSDAWYQWQTRPTGTRPHRRPLPRARRAGRRRHRHRRHGPPDLLVPRHQQRPLLLHRHGPHRRRATARRTFLTHLARRAAAGRPAWCAAAARPRSTRTTRPSASSTAAP